MSRYFQLACAASVIPALVGIWSAQAADRRAGPESDYSAIGLPFGSFRAFPALSLGVLYDDNVYRSDRVTFGDTFFRIAPQIGINSDWGRHELRLDAGADIRLYSELTDEDRTDWYVRASGRLDVTRPFRISGGAGFEVRHEARGSADEPSSAVSPTEYDLTTVGLKADYLASRFGIQLLADYEGFNYSQTELNNGTFLNNDDRDRADLTVALKLKYDFSPGYGVFATVTYLDRSYDDSPDSDEVDRNANGVLLDGGVSFELTRLLVGQVFLGYSTYTFDDPEFSDVENFDYGASITWSATDLTTVTLEVGQTLEPSTLDNVSGVMTTSYSLSVEHELLRNLSISAGAGYLVEEFEESRREDNTFDASLGAEYSLNRYLSATLRYSYATRDSSRPGQDYNENVVGFGITGKL